MADLENALLNAGITTGLLDSTAVPELKTKARRASMDVLQLVSREYRFPRAALYRALARQQQLAYVERGDLQFDAQLLTSLRPELMLRKRFVPVRVGEQITVLLSDPADQGALEAVQRATGQAVGAALAEPMLIETLIRQHFNLFDSNLDAIAVFDAILKEAYVRKATDLHFEPLDQSMGLRMRVDGQMQHYEQPIGAQLATALITRIKVLAGLDIAEQFLPQDGGFAYTMAGWHELDAVEMRVATVPTRWGERATLRILGQETADLSLQQLGMADQVLERVRQSLHRPHGMLLVTGPTGSGKSTTLYAGLRELDADQLNIMTVEDPIEQVVAGTSQVQVSGKTSFAKALRSFLRHDPDVMLVGEIRDNETAETAVRAAMTGHMVLSTLHTNSAVATIGRLVDIGCPPYLLAATLVGVLAQRLLRRLCDTCRQARPVSAHEAKLLEVAAGTSIYDAVGCARCMGSGYRSRIGIYEMLWINDHLQHLIREGASDELLAQAAIEADLLTTLWQDAREKILAGTTSIAEAIHLCQET